MTATNYLLLALGAIFWLIYKHHYAKKLKNYCFQRFLSNNIEPLFLNLIFGIALILSTQGVTEGMDYEVLGFNAPRLMWFFIGMGGQYIARKIYKNILNRF